MDKVFLVIPFFSRHLAGGLKPGMAGWLLGVLLCWGPPDLYAQKQAKTSIADKFSRFQHYSMAQGLSSNWVSDMAQDEDGFMWFATNEGLNRFDGEQFTAFFYREDGKSIPCDRITRLLMLPGHRLLIGTEKGLCVLHLKRMEFEQISLPEAPDSIPNSPMVSQMRLTKNAQIWLSVGRAIIVLNQELKPVQSYFKTVLPADYYVRDFLELPNGAMAIKHTINQSPWYAPWQLIDFQTQSFRRLSEVYPEYGTLDSVVMPGCVASDARHNLWMTFVSTHGPNALSFWDKASGTTRVYLKNQLYGQKNAYLGQYLLPFLLPDSLLFVQRYFGPPIIFNLRDGSVTDLPAWKSSSPDGKIIVNFIDRDGNLWLCPRAEGIFFLTLKNLPATSMTALNAEHVKTMEKALVSKEWFGFRGRAHAGRWVLSSNNGGLYSLNQTEKGVEGPISANPLDAFAYVSYFAPDRGDTLWTSALDGLHWYAARSNTHGPLKQRFRGLDSLDKRFLYRDDFGLIWGRVFKNGVCYFDTRSRQLTHFQSRGNQPRFPIESATACAQAPDGDMWFCFGSEEKCLVRWRRATGVFETVEPIGPPGISCAKAFDILADTHGNLWLMVDQQWYIMDIQTRKATPFGKLNGLVTNNPGGRCLDRNGHIWFATAFGLSRYDPGSRQMRTFYQSDGLLSDMIHNVELMDTVHNILFVSTDQGMCLFEPDKIGAAASAPPTFITRVQVSGTFSNLPQSRELYLRYDQNDLRIEFTGVNFINGPGNRYAYSMEPEGRPARWKEAGTDNFANFLNVAPGDYRFRVRTANSDGVWGEKEAVLRIVIYPPWWQTWTFRISLLGLLLGLSWALNRRQIRRTENREKEKSQIRQQLADLEMKALRAQMNPHFVFNALNSVQNFILKNDTREASKYLTKFARLMRLILENSESPMVQLGREIELLRYYTELEQLRFNNRFSFDFQIDSSLNVEQISIPGMLIQPHIENAIWHGLMHKTEPGHLWVRFIQADAKTLVCEIQDDGVGRVQAAEMEQNRPKNHRSTGLANIQTRLDLLNAQLSEDIRLDFEDLYQADGQACGTKVVVRMPLTRVTG